MTSVACSSANMRSCRRCPSRVLAIARNLSWSPPRAGRAKVDLPDEWWPDRARFVLTVYPTKGFVYGPWSRSVIHRH
jgi:hypothetical protein